MRQASELKFNPIKFEICGTIGSPGTNGDNRNFFRSALSQNIVYCVWERAKTAVQIADDLGVSPVYVESEAEYLAEYGFLTEQGGKYLCNILLDELDDDLTAIKDGMYTKAAKLIANELFDALTGSGILHDTRILCSQGDDNFLLWSLIPYLAALSGEKLMDQSISFDAVATIRPDGGHNLCCASVAAPNVKKPAYSESMQYFCGPCWNGNQKYTLWQVDSEWSAKRVNDRYTDTADRILSLVSRAAIGTLSEDEYAFLAENGILKTSGACGGNFQAAWEIVRFENAEIKKELLAIGERVKDNHWAQLEAMKEPYTGALLSRTPKHLRKMREYTLQSLFFSDNWFLLHCMKELVGSGKLKMPTQGQKQSLSTILIPNA